MSRSNFRSRVIHFSSIWLLSLTICFFHITLGAHAKDFTLQKIPAVSTRIVGGVKTTISEYPYIVAVKVRGVQKCGGSIIGSRVVLTAAHCFEFTNISHHYSIQYGQTDMESTMNVIQASGYKKHPNYHAPSFDYDVGLIYLTKAIPLGLQAQLIQLATHSPTPGSRVSIAGWGSTQYGGRQSKILLALQVHTIPLNECSHLYRYKNKITPRMLCAGVQVDGQDSCEGDSGGPLVANGVQVGICSFGFECAHKDYPGVYVNVAAVRNWILLNKK
ncbi:trypsin alpha-3-like [Ceratitis capitata]|uniref:trypsin alpha-3-like n=1 Tax=Ceratitis capitata TaxID=7213 RepID=UPI0006188FFB|nr:trypsin alpha-3-like [Ceratitis capitata]